MIRQVLDEAVGSGRQDEGEAEALAADGPYPERIGAVAEPRDLGLDPRHRLLPHAVAPIDDPVDSGQRNARGARDILERHAPGGARFAARLQRAAHSIPRVRMVRTSGTSSS